MPEYITKEKLEEWLDTFNPDVYVGERLVSDRCPLANMIMDLNPNVKYVDVFTENCVVVGKTFDNPDWVKRLIRALDRDKAQKITAGDVREAYSIQG